MESIGIHVPTRKGADLRKVLPTQDSEFIAAYLLGIRRDQLSTPVAFKSDQRLERIFTNQLINENQNDELPRNRLERLSYKNDGTAS